MYETNFNVNLITVDTDAVGRRIDNFLITYLQGGVPKNKIYRILRKGIIRVNKRRIKWIYRLNIGDVIYLPSMYRKIPQKKIKQISDKITKKLYASFVHEDEHILVLNKPSGIAVHGGTGLSVNIIDALRILRPDLFFLKLVYRLDRDASGVLLLAKNNFSLIQLHEQLRVNIMKKEYLVLVSGQCAFCKNTVTAPLLRSVNSFGMRNVMVNLINGKYSETSFIVKERFVSSTLLKVNLLTGRTHQIRVHAQYIGHPIAYDRRYGNIFFNEKMKCFFGLNRLFLHAAKLNFIHPSTGKVFYIRVPLDEVLSNCLSFLRRG